MEDYIRDTDITVKRLADLSGVNRGTFSAILNRNPPKPLSVSQLDKITQAMGLSEGALYSLFVDECFVLVAPNWRRLRPFLIRCAELEKLDVIRDILTCLAERLSHNPAVFDAAEEMFLRGHYPSAILLYEYIIESEQSSHSERLAISHLRLFQIFEKDGQKSTETAMRFLNYRKRLPEPLALDGLLMLAEMYYLKQQWGDMELMTDELIELSQAVYKFSGSESQELYQPKYPLIYYYGQAYLLKAGSFENRGMFKQAKKWIEHYKDLSWFQGLNDLGKSAVHLFSSYAEANLMSIEIKMGNVQAIPRYINYLKDHPSEIMEGLVTLLESALKYSFEIDSLLELFAEELETYNCFNPTTLKKQYKEHFSLRRYENFCRVYSEYCFKTMNYDEGAKYNLYRLNILLTTQDKALMADSMLLFERYREYVSTDLQYKYNYICKEAWEHEKSQTVAIDGISVCS
ncbi:helix-turn-helix domain-containing protein [Paenibacillus sp. CAA11]|uniref:helix-turn-helix domain-containing protein n=1 Tax=Paenibacillus sp. CAA11 TaxID=1532905 RepID=UPI00131EEFB3|nr:helix-turn-helix transcriptional regulator [Paenibacillus sp. CAA11]